MNKIRKLFFHNYIFFLIGSIIFLLPSLIAYIIEEKIIQQIAEEFKYKTFKNTRKTWYKEEK